MTDTDNLPRCPICAAHPGWATPDLTARRDPADVCRACLGTSVDYRRTWAILTGGPCPVLHDATLADAMAYVAQSIPLKRGWVGAFTVGADGAYYYAVVNSKGNRVPGVGARVAPAPSPFARR